MTRTNRFRKRRAGGRGSVLLIVLLLCGSGILRIATGAGEVIAKGTESSHEAMLETNNMQTGDTEDKKAPERQHSLNRTDASNLLKLIQKRENLVTRREKQVEMRTKALAVADTEIEKRLIALEQAEAALRATLALAETSAEDDLARLTAVYERMKPKDAAAVFEAMEPDFAAGFLARMTPDSAAALLAGLSPEVAYSISVILAGRNANVPKT